MKPRTPSDLNNLGIVLVQSNCFRPALKAFQDSDMLQQKKCLPAQRRYSAEAVPPPATRTLSVHAVDLSELSRMPNVRSFLEFLKVKTFRKSILLVRLPFKSPFAAAIIWYNQAMVHLALSQHTSDQENREKSLVDAQHLLELANVTLRKWYACLTKGKEEHLGLVRATLMLRLLIVHTKSQWTDDDDSSLHRHMHALVSRISSHDLNHNVLSQVVVSPNVNSSRSQTFVPV